MTSQTLAKHPRRFPERKQWRDRRGIHLPLQGIDYWSRVAWHHRRGEFQKFGHFAGRELPSESPLLIMVAPSLHVHPATDTLLRYISSKIEWELLGIDERWKKELRVVFRKRPEQGFSG